MDVGFPLKGPLGIQGHMRPYWNLDVGWFMLVFLLSLVRRWRTVTLQLSGFYCNCGCSSHWQPICAACALRSCDACVPGLLYSRCF